MPLTQLEKQLRRLARDRIKKGQLPRTAPGRIWGGKGAGRSCALCDKPIGANESELEVEQNIDGTVRPLRFHVACQLLWQLECARETARTDQSL